MMSQQAVHNFLKRNRGKWYSAKQIASYLKVNGGSIQRNLSRMRRGDMYIISRRIGRGYEYMMR